MTSLADIEVAFLRGANHLSTTSTPVGLFHVNESTGAVTVATSLDKHPGLYNITVRVQDSGSPTLHSTAVVHITVLEGNNAAPIWKFPNATHSSVNVLEVSDGIGDINYF